MANYLDYDGLTTYDSTLKTYDSTDVKMNGTRAVGTSKKCARADHVHPTDTSRAPLASPAFTGTPTAPTASSGTNTTQIATTAFVQSAIGSSASDFTGATSSADGTHGLVPAPLAGDDVDILFGDGEWKIIYIDDSHNGNTYTISLEAGDSLTPAHVSLASITIPVASTTYCGLMSFNDKTKLDGFSSASDYALKTDITGIYKYKGSVATASNLPSSGQSAGDVYNIEAESTYGPAGTNVAWVAASGNVAAHWDALGGAFTITSITTAQINALFA